jgi:ER membrane protein complex subunit 6
MRYQNALASMRTLVSCFAGAVSGVIGLENLTGFAFFLGTIVATAVVVAGVQCQGKPSKYFQHGWW